MNILIAASECVPFVKTGGLADVAGALPAALAKGRKDSIAVVLPKYAQLDAARFELELLPGKLLIPVGGHVEEGFVWRLKKDRKKLFSWPSNISHYFIENKKYFERPGLYRAGDRDFPDNDERFTFYSRAVLELCKFARFAPDVIHCHDWQAGLVPAYLKTVYATDAYFHRTATLFTIHNIAYQGLFPYRALETAGFHYSEFTPERLEYYGQFSFLKSALVYADKLSTVSPTYAQEVQRNNAFGRGMEGILRSRAAHFEGILNGLDYGIWDPANDGALAARYEAKSKDLLKRKLACKADLQRASRLEPDPNAPLIGMVSRLDPQKGFTIVLELMKQMIAEGSSAQWVVLGQGDAVIQEQLLSLARNFPKKVSVELNFNDPLAHKIYAGADVFLMPSLFEPCGLSQMISMAYGTFPVVTPTGGLLDTVVNWDAAKQRGNGFVAEVATTPAVRKALVRALQLVAQAAQRERAMRLAMSTRFTWDDSARRYRKLYEKALDSALRASGVPSARRAS